MSGLSLLRPAGVALVAALLGPAAAAHAATRSFHGFIPLEFSLTCNASQTVRAPLRPHATAVRLSGQPKVGDAVEGHTGDTVGHVTAVTDQLTQRYPGILVTAVGDGSACSGTPGKAVPGNLGSLEVRYRAPTAVVTPRGRVGSLLIGRSTAADVRRVEGPPTSVDRHPAGARRPGTALVYDWGDLAFPTEFIVNARTGRLSDVYSSSAEYVTAAGTSTLTLPGRAARLQHTKLVPISTPDNCSDEAIVVAPRGNVNSALAYRTTFASFLYSSQYLNTAPILGISPDGDTRMFVSGPGSIFAPKRTAGAALKPVCFISRRRRHRR